MLIAVLLFASCVFAGLVYPPETIELIPSSPNTPDVLNDLLIPADKYEPSR